MSWHGHLALNYRSEPVPEGWRTVLYDRHHGPLRILQSLYPEGAGICHNILIHPPGGMVGGDQLVLEGHLPPHAHALVTTPGATRFYRSRGEDARQSVSFRLEPYSRLEWLPLETIVHSAALAENRMRFDLAPGAEMIGWDLLALGLPASQQKFEQGHIRQEIEIPGLWLERAQIRADDHLLLNSPAGWDGQTVLATLWFAGGEPPATHTLNQLLSASCARLEGHPLSRRAGCTRVGDQGVVLRVLADHVEAPMQLLRQVWADWRQLAWGLPACLPRVW